MDLNRRLIVLEQEVERRRQIRAKADDAWQFRYQFWPTHGWPEIPPPPEPLPTLEEFKALWRRIRGPSPYR